MKANLLFLAIITFSSVQHAVSQKCWYNVDSLNITIEIDSIKSDFSSYESYINDIEPIVQQLDACPNLILLEDYDIYLVIQDCFTITSNMCYPSKFIVFDINNLNFSEGMSRVNLDEYISSTYLLYSFEESMPDLVCYKLISLQYAQPHLAIRVD